MTPARDSAERLRALLSRIPDGLHDATRSLVIAAGSGCPLHVFRRDDLEWTVADGDVAELDQRALTALEVNAGMLLPRGVAVGRTAVVCTQPPPPEISLDLLRQACVWVELIAREGVAADEIASLDDEADVMRTVAQQILSARDLDQVLLAITNHTLRMSESDICGVFLRDGDLLHMRSCTGHRVIDTARLTMGRGQGVAGLVFETGQVAKVDSYLQDSTISTDFMSLAVQEATRSALAVPLTVHGELIGVLEVWRRRYSSFTDRDVRRLISLADLATIAIENGRLYDSQRAMVSELDAAKMSLERQFALLSRSSELQQSLLDIVLSNNAIEGSVARTLGTELGCDVVIASASGDIDAHYPRALDAVAIIAAATGESGNLPQRAHRVDIEHGTSIWAHPIVAGDAQYGAVFLHGDNTSADLMSIACSQGAMVCSLAQLQARAASAARAEALDQLLWDLLDGTPEQRSAARTRTHQMGVRLKGAHRVAYGVIDNAEALADREGWSTSSLDQARRSILDKIRACSSPASPTLSAIRGNWIVVLAPIKDRERARLQLDKYRALVTGVHADFSVSWGMSSVHDDPSGYPTAFDEARTAHAAARRLGAVSLYDELGIVRLLLGSGDSPDLAAFIDEITQPLTEYDQKHEGALLQTLRAFFDANCSQKAAAERLYVHPKTLSYRLELIRKLTDLDLSLHADRMRADLALRLLDVADAVRLPTLGRLSD
ncbi:MULTISPECIES: helix-turn-helix domain-containing protein [unclassified Rhodococcus (in: high G+C Gram-positive bacteria)]|uniref:helix-turn-helix domain-containing protein n=1 Tax=unclassified Rhodococcus (in: high G+C Gram-positive bacteria) TaxID=192944 RepID=UPI0015E881A6|nr:MULTISPECIES: helix-turn-helix domain-containing protein [unclassified Rhodococcus (in: high G+C Gram-positive bacteria)]